jgi:nuclear GTP-binding protein
LFFTRNNYIVHDNNNISHFIVIGYPNVGKSSVINTLLSKKSCKAAPVPGETKIWQYVTLFKRISLIDCPGVVVDSAGDTEEDSVLKGVVRAERLEHPEDFVAAIQKRVKREHIAAQYKIQPDGWPELDDGDNTNENNSSIVLMDLIARKCGRLRKGGDPCLRTAALMLINDYQRGRLPHYVAPPELKEESSNNNTTNENDATVRHEVHVDQNLDEIGVDKMEKVGNDDSNLGDDTEKGNDGSEQQPDDDDETSSDKVMDDNNANQPTTGLTTSTDLIGEGDWDD